MTPSTLKAYNYGVKLKIPACVEEVHLSPRLNLSIVLKRLLTVALLASVFGFSAAVVMYFALRGRTVDVPNVIGKSKEEAESVLDEVGLRIKEIGTQNDMVPADAVIIDQSPAAGTTVKTGQQVRVSLSLGAPTPTPQGR
ncbi:MAG: PASTA domain-containing protein [Acidobacteria bacterium]|nr:PASTA domain-containing protein [Acidobacteriota bacterium]